MIRKHADWLVILFTFLPLIISSAAVPIHRSRLWL
jgi:hypothetical protein